MKEDGACLFRAVAFQVYGDQEMHGVVRKHCMDYMVGDTRVDRVLSSSGLGYVHVSLIFYSSPLCMRFVVAEQGSLCPLYHRGL